MTIIPAIDLRGGQCVRLYQGQFDRQTSYDKDPVSLAREYRTMGFDELHVVDLDGARSGRQENQETIRRIIETSNLAVQLGGGIRAQSQLESWLSAGVARVVIGSLAVTQPRLVRKWLERYGPAQIVLALDVTIAPGGTPYVATHGWTQSSGLTLWQCMDDFFLASVQHVLCTDISRDGALTGPNLELYAQLVDTYPGILLQASGGVRNVDDLVALRNNGAAAAITGRALLEGTITAREIGTFLPAA